MVRLHTRRLQLRARGWAAAPILIIPSIAAAQPCAPHWGNEFSNSGIDYAEVTASIVFDDDGPGPHPPSLFAGGQLRTAGGQSVDFVAKWDGHAWSPVATGLTAGVHCFAVFDEDGPGPRPPALYAGTLMYDTNMPGALQRLDGDHWTPVPGLGGEYIKSLLVFDDDGSGPHAPSLVAGGYVRVNGTATVLAKWDGHVWTDIAESMDYDVDALISVDEDGDGPMPPVLIAGGGFTFAGDGFLAQGVARWDGATWSPLGDGLGPYATVHALAWFDPDGDGPRPAQLYAGGEFYKEYGSPSDSIARFGDGRWKDVAGDIAGYTLSQHGVYALAVFDSDGAGPVQPLLFAGGGFTSIGATQTTNLAAWTGDDWKPAGAPNLPVYTLCEYTEAGAQRASLVAGGSFALAGGRRANRAAALRGDEWSPLAGGVGGGSQGYGVYPPGASFDIGPVAMAVFDRDGSGPAEPCLIVGGFFTTAGDSPATNIAQWDGNTWSTLGDGLEAMVVSMTAFDADAAGPDASQLYVSGYFGRAGTEVVEGLARWDGSKWSAVPGWEYGVADSMAVIDPDGDGPEPQALYLGTFLARVEGKYYQGVIKWDGQQWSAVGDGADNTIVYAIASFDDDGAGPDPPALYIACQDANSGSPPLHGIARFDGTSWSAVGGGLSYLPDSFPGGRGFALAVFDDDGPGPHAPALYVAGDFDLAGGVYSPGLAKWTGSHWEAGATFLQYAYTNALQVFDDAARPEHPALFVGGGNFTSVNGVSVHGIARFSDGLWSSPDSGVAVPPIPSVYSRVTCLAAFDPDGPHSRRPRLYVGGAFTLAGGADSPHIASWGSNCTNCTPDLNGDGAVGPADLGVLIGNWGPTTTRADLTGDGRVDASDLALLLGSWGPCP